QLARALRDLRSLPAATEHAAQRLQHRRAVRRVDPQRRILDALDQHPPRLAERLLDDVEQLADPRPIALVVQPRRPRRLLVDHRDHAAPPSELAGPPSPARRFMTYEVSVDSVTTSS